MSTYMKKRSHSFAIILFHYMNVSKVDHFNKVSARTALVDELSRGKKEIYLKTLKLWTMKLLEREDRFIKIHHMKGYLKPPANASMEYKWKLL